MGCDKSCGHSMSGCVGITIVAIDLSTQSVDYTWFHPVGCDKSCGHSMSRCVGITIVAIDLSTQSVDHMVSSSGV